MKQEDVEYRVKPKSEKKYRAFKNCDELIAEYEKRFHKKARCGVHRLPLIWVRSKDNTDYRAMITAFYEDNVTVGANLTAMSTDFLFKHFTFLDGSSCGAEVTE